MRDPDLRGYLFEPHGGYSFFTEAVISRVAHKCCAMQWEPRTRSAFICIGCDSEEARSDPESIPGPRFSFVLHENAAGLVLRGQEGSVRFGARVGSHVAHQADSRSVRGWVARVHAYRTPASAHTHTSARARARAHQRCKKSSDPHTNFHSLGATLQL